MALLGYTSKEITYPQFFCGGSLITDRYVLTAAHCAEVLTSLPKVVRLGEVNLLTDEDCESKNENSGEYCAPKYLDIPVETIIYHKKFNGTSYKNDIALIRMAHKVPEFNEFIRPICLPFDLKANENFLKNKTLEIAGWGKKITAFTRIVDNLQHATVKSWDFQRCMKDLPQELKPIDETQICATGSGLTEACKGDSGGPLTLKEIKDGDERTIQVGIVSVKAMDSCGTQELPSIFTRVDTYLNWILSHLKP